MRLARTIVACGLLALVGLFCAGSTSWAEQPRVVVRIGVQPNILPDVILRARKTLESKYGDRYDFQWIDTTHAGAAIEAMVAGSMDITDAAALPLIQAAERGLKIWAVADSIGDVVGIAVRTDSGIQSPSDLAGKTLAYPGKGSLQYALIELALAGTNVKLSDLKLVRAGFADMPLLIKRKAIDGFSGAEPFLYYVLADGEAKLIIRPSSVIQQKEGTMIVGAIGVRSEFAKAHPDALKAFLTEFQNASRSIKSDPDGAAEIFSGVFPGVVTKNSFNYAVNHGLVYFKDVKPRKEDWQKFIEFSNKAGLTKIDDPAAFLERFLHPEFAADQ